MSRAHDLYEELSTLGARLWQVGDQIRCQAPPGILTLDLIDRIREHKPDLLVILTTAKPPALVSRPNAPDFWDKAALVRGDALLLTNHLMDCPTCKAPRDRYCDEGRRIRAIYEAKCAEVWH